MKRMQWAAAALLALGAMTVVWAGEGGDKPPSKNKVGGGYIIYPSAPKEADKEGKLGPVIFSHLAHGESEKAAGFKCTECHPAIPFKKRSFKMADINAGKSCGQCHNGKTKGPKSGEVAFEITQCARCHMPQKDLVMKTKGPGAVTFSHGLHTGVLEEAKGENGETVVKIVEKAGYACGACHPNVFQPKADAPIGMAAPHEKGGCAHCHDGKQTSPNNKVAPSATATESCAKCHKPA